MEAGSYLHFLNFIFMVVTASVPVYLAVRIGTSNRRLFCLSVGLAVFASVHSLYHLADGLQLGELADDYLLPISVVLLVIYGVYYYRTGV